MIIINYVHQLRIIRYMWITLIKSSNYAVILVSMADGWETLFKNCRKYFIAFMAIDRLENDSLISSFAPLIQRRFFCTVEFQSTIFTGRLRWWLKSVGNIPSTGCYFLFSTIATKKYVVLGIGFLDQMILSQVCENRLASIYCLIKM